MATETPPLPAEHSAGGKVRLKVAAHIVSTAGFDGPGNCYRYWLERRWDGKPFGSPGYAVQIGMNPSVADLDFDDPTVARCVERARRWGHGALVMLNAFGYRCTDKQRLLEVADPVGAGNDAAILHYATGASVVVVGWGKPPEPLKARGAALAARLRAAGVEPLCFKVNADGSPKHPLYVALDAPLVPYPTPAG